MFYTNNIHFEELKYKILCYVIEFRHEKGYEHTHPSEFNIFIPTNYFSQEELKLLKTYEGYFLYTYEGFEEVFKFPCYKVSDDYVFTNEINLSALI